MLQRCFHCWSAVCHSAIAVEGRAYPGDFSGSPPGFEERNCCRSRWIFPGLPCGKETIVVIGICGLIDSLLSDGDVESPTVRTALVCGTVGTTVGRGTSDPLLAKLSRTECRWTWITLGARAGPFGPGAVRPLVAR